MTVRQAREKMNTFQYAAMPTDLPLVHTICLPEISVQSVKFILIVFLQWVEWGGWNGCQDAVYVCHYSTVWKETCSIYSSLWNSTAAALIQCSALCGYLPRCAKVLTTVHRWIIINHIQWIKFPISGTLSIRSWRSLHLANVLRRLSRRSDSSWHIRCSSEHLGWTQSRAQ